VEGKSGGSMACDWDKSDLKTKTPVMGLGFPRACKVASPCQIAPKPLVRHQCFANNLQIFAN